jgi:hypothetical protein
VSNSTNNLSKYIGYIKRDEQTSTTQSNILSCNRNDNESIIIIKPTTNIINIKLVNNNHYLNVSTGKFDRLLYLTDTNADGTILSADCSDWLMLLEFEPIYD